MNVEYLLQLLGNRFNTLTSAKEQAFLTGDLERINSLDVEINGVLDTINKLKLLEGISQTALVTSFTEAEVVKNGIEASFNSSNTINTISDPTGIMLGYDISSYATDPLHEQKIADILEYMGKMDSPLDIDTYINNEAIASPVTGQMVYNSALKYNVDIRLMMALMELDSRFGTVGLAIKTLNPGNIGNNDDGDTHTYSSWEEGVDAVARWLDRHRIINEVVEEVVEDQEIIKEPEEEAEVNDGNVDEATEEMVPVIKSQIISPELTPDISIPTEEPSAVDQTVSVIRKNKRRV